MHRLSEIRHPLSAFAGSRVREWHGAKAEHDLDHLARARGVPQTAEEP